MDKSGPFEHMKPNCILRQHDTDSHGNPNGVSFFYGYNEDGGKTALYQADGTPEETTDTPSEDGGPFKREISDGDCWEND